MAFRRRGIEELEEGTTLLAPPPLLSLASLSGQGNPRSNLQQTTSSSSLSFLRRLIHSSLLLEVSLPRLVVYGFSIWLLALLVLFLSCRESMYSPLNWEGAGKQKMLEHHRVVAEGLIWASTIGNSSLDYMPRSPTQNLTEEVRLVALSHERVVPYIYALVASLFPSPYNALGERDKVSDVRSLHIVNTARTRDEDRPATKADYLAPLRSLPFITIHDLPALSSSSAATNEVKTPEKQLQVWLRRQIRDYIDALRVCLLDRVGQEEAREGQVKRRDGEQQTVREIQVTSQSSWCIILEEDAIATSSFLKKFKERVAEPLSASLGDVAFVKLFFSNKWDGFEDVDRVAVVSACLFLSFLILLSLGGARICLSVVRHRKKKEQHSSGCSFSPHRQGKVPRRLLFGRLSLLFLYIFSLLLSSALLMGKQHLKGLVLPFVSGLRPMQHFMANIAMAYPSDRVPDLIQFLELYVERESAPAPIDWVIARDWVEERKREGGKEGKMLSYEIVPSLFQHIGAFSSGTVSAGKYFGDYQKMPQDSLFQA